GGRRVPLRQDNRLAIGRSTLLAVLQRHAAAAGVEVHFDSRVDVDDLDADLVVAADGVSSATRERHAAALGTRVVTEEGYYLWCGTEVALPSAVFSPVRTDAGTFVTHAYPYAADRSTFLIETDEETWRRAGFDVTTADTTADRSDETALTYLSEAFRDELHGHRLIGNRTRWTQFRTITCERWHLGNLVLLGDAAHTAHYSIGSGTKLAMEDAITLDQVLAESEGLEQALTRYEAERRPAVEHLQQTAIRSMRWWNTFPHRLDLPVEQLFVSYMTRAGKVSLERFVETSPEVARAGLAAYAGEDPPADLGSPADWVVSRPFRVGAWSTPSRLLGAGDPVEVVDAPLSADPRPGSLRLLATETVVDGPWGPAADELVADVRKALEADCGGVLVICRDDLDDVLTMLETAERLRAETDGVVAVRSDVRWRDHLVAALASGRADLIDLVERGA
ncbi:MAG: oxidoreductase, partial [Nocardioidaceae bacterium]|nr:oxidoreductase [Nocardioidaceae bacterium]